MKKVDKIDHLKKNLNFIIKKRGTELINIDDTE